MCCLLSGMVNTGEYRNFENEWEKLCHRYAQFPMIRKCQVSSNFMILIFTIHVGDISEPMLGSDIQLQPKEISQEQDGIKLPPPLFNNEALISKYNANDSIGLFFTLYNNSTLFPVNGGNNLSSDRLETVVGSRIIAATVSGLELCNLEEQERVTIVLQLLNPEQNVSLENLTVAI